MISSAESSLKSSNEQSNSDTQSSSLVYQSTLNVKKSSSDTSYLDTLSPEERDVIKNFYDHTYQLSERAPRILEVRCTDVYVFKDGPNQDELKVIEEDEWNGILYPKIKTTGYSEYAFQIGAISTKYFESREKLDEIYSYDWCRSSVKLPYRKGLFFEHISFQKALKDVFSIKIRCHMKYYSSNKDELIRDLGHDYAREDYSLKQLEEEVFFKLCLKMIFGDEEDQEETENSTIIFRDFKILHEDGNEIFATARRGKRYLIFFGNRY